MHPELLIAMACCWLLTAGWASGAAFASGMSETVPSEQARDLERAPQVPLAARLLLKSAVTTTGARLTLGQLASCTGAPSICAEYAAVDLGEAPEPGRTTLWPLARLRAIAAAEWDGARVEIIGNGLGAGVKVTAPAALVPEETLLRSLQSALDRAIAGLGATEEVGSLSFQVRHVSLSAAGGGALRPEESILEFPEITAERLADYDWVHRHLLGRQRLRLLARSGIGGASESSARALLVIATTEATMLAPVAARSLAHGSTISSSDLKVASVPLAAATQVSRTPRGLTEYLGLRLRRSVVVGQPLAWTDVEAPKVVSRGQRLKLTLTGGGLQVTSMVRAQEAGRVGQTIAATVESTKKQLKVRIIDGEHAVYAR